VEIQQADTVVFENHYRLYGSDARRLGLESLLLGNSGGNVS